MDFATILTFLAAVFAGGEVYFAWQHWLHARRLEHAAKASREEALIQVPTAAEIQKYAGSSQLQKQSEVTLTEVQAVRRRMTRGLLGSSVVFAALLVLAIYAGQQAFQIWKLTRQGPSGPGCIESIESPQTGPFIDIKANGCNGILSLKKGESFVYSWRTSGVTVCMMQTPWVSGSTLNGTSTPVRPDETGYPAPGDNVAISMSCTDGTRSVSDAVVVRVVQ